ncbi:MAG: TetR family transcriptional regulator, partial [Oscillospiraceae bacterium]|nr:TetR family transcriptional regulator [Oscillospiraceae bacterium]
MSDSNITKHALAASLRTLMEEYPFEKITVAQICEQCGINRKNFYYHFKDKYDLVNWIFDTDLLTLTASDVDLNSEDGMWRLLKA